MSIIKNAAALGSTPVRKDALTIVEAGLAAIGTRQAITAAVTVEEDVLQVNDQTFSLLAYEHVYIVGFGKVACVAAQTLEQLLEGRVKEGAVVGIAEKVCDVVDTYAGTHPLPSSLNYTATKHIEEVAHKATKDDLVLVIVSGGGSALLCSSMGECDQSTQLFSSFLPSGGTIEELNVVRKHLSRLKGGGLAKALYPAEVIGLIFSDVPGGDLSAVASGPTYFDTTTKEDAQAIIERYNLGTYSLTETPKEERYFEKVHNIPLVTNETALAAMSATATKLGYEAEVITSSLYAAPEEVAAIITDAREPGQALCIGGETVLSVPKDCTGKGGRNDALALSVLPALAPGQVFVSVASDGRDNTEAAGALVDSSTEQKALEAGVSREEHMECFDSFPFFKAVGGHIMTGPLESNVSDLMLLLTAKQASAATVDDISVAVVKDSRGTPTVAVTVYAGEFTGTFSVPSGASTGAREVVAVPPQAAHTLLKETILPALHGMSVVDQAAIDAKLKAVDGTHDFSAIGGNVALGVSVAVAKVAAQVKGVATHEHIADLFAHRTQSTAPRLFVNLINGGKHAAYGSAIQEHQIIPETDDVATALTVVRHVQQELGQQLKQLYGAAKVKVGDEGGFIIPNHDPLASFTHVAAAIEAVSPEIAVSIGADMAAGSFYSDGAYTLETTPLTTADLQHWYEGLQRAVPALRYVEDPFFEDDFEAFATYKDRLREVMLIGDDLTTTNVETLRTAVAKDAVGALIVKPNQIGTVSDTLATMDYAYSEEIQCIVSHRSGETMDDFIADLAVGTKCFGLKAGAPTAPHRAVKYERLRAILG